MATGVAFFTGSRLRAQLPPSTRLEPSTVLAQAGGKQQRLPRRSNGSRTAAQPGAGGGAAKVAEERDAAVSARSTFELVYSLVQENFVDKLPSDREMSRGAVRAMLTSLRDPNSYFVTAEQYALFEAEARGEFAGIGTKLHFQPAKNDGYTQYKLTVIAPLPGSPARRAGLKPGDVITHIDGRWVLGASPAEGVSKLASKATDGDATEEELERESEAAKERLKNGVRLLNAYMLLRSGENEKRVLTVQRPGVSAPLKIELTTAVTRIAPLETKTLADGVAYVKLSALTEETEAAFRKTLESVRGEAGLVLDLRGNPGGDLEAARRIAGMLGGTGAFLTEIGPGGKKTALSLTKDASATPERPVVVLVDRGTAAAAEALAVTLSDKGLATLVGTRTFGNATAQGLYPLDDGSAFTLTVGKWLGPKGTDWQTAGLSPKVALAEDSGEDYVIARAVSELRSRSHIATAPGSR